MSNQKYNELYNYLALNDQPEKADLVIGFGHFDLRIAAHCANLFCEGMAKHILFTGGVGAGSGSFTKPEAIEFREHLIQNYTDIGPEHILIEENSTNTGENIRFSKALINKLKEKPNSFILVTTPSRQRRVYQTFIQYFPAEQYRIINSPPNPDYKNDQAIYNNQDEDLRNQLRGELQRLIEYPAKGFCADLKIPEKFLKLYRELS